jgi:hypothetical protein
LLDGPAVLGWRRWRKIQQSQGLVTISDVARRAIIAKILPPLPVRQLSHTILSVIDEAATMIVNDYPRPAAIKRVAATVDAVLDGLANR